MTPERRFGGHCWGSLKGGQLRCGGRHYQLVVFPPGTNAREATCLRAWLCWPFAGTTMAIVAALLLVEVVPAPVAIAVALGLLTGGHLRLRRAVRRQRRGVRIVHAEYLIGPGTRADLERCQHLAAIGATLTTAERAMNRGQFSPVDFEWLWSSLHAQAGAMADSATTSSERP